MPGARETTHEDHDSTFGGAHGLRSSHAASQGQEKMLEMFRTYLHSTKCINMHEKQINVRLEQS